MDAACFENLRSFHVTSAEDERYNCIAFAAGIEDAWWDPLGVWPADLSADYRVGTFVSLYERHGFVECNNADHEPGFSKIAIYVLGREVQHAARQEPNGKWKSKLGPDEDIEHDSLNDLAGAEYGQPVRFLKRVIPK